MRSPASALAVVLWAVVSASADSSKQGQAQLYNPDPNVVHKEPTYKPYSTFGSDIPGYKNPTVGGAAPGKADAHPFHPFADFGNAAGGDGTNGARRAVPVSPPIEPGPPPLAVPEKKEDEERDAAAAEAAAEASPVDEYGKPIDVEREDAQANFHTVIEAFIAKNNVDGCWPLKEVERTLCLTYLSTDVQRLKKDGKGAYKGVVVLRDAKRMVNRAMIFKIDFSGDEWSVVWAKVLGAKKVNYRRKSGPEAPSAPPALPAFRPGVSQ